MARGVAPELKRLVEILNRMEMPQQVDLAYALELLAEDLAKAKPGSKSTASLMKRIDKVLASYGLSEWRSFVSQQVQNEVAQIEKNLSSGTIKANSTAERIANLTVSVIGIIRDSLALTGQTIEAAIPQENIPQIKKKVEEEVKRVTQKTKRTPPPQDTTTKKTPESSKKSSTPPPAFNFTPEQRAILEKIWSAQSNRAQWVKAGATIEGLAQNILKDVDKFLNPKDTGKDALANALIQQLALLTGSSDPKKDRGLFGVRGGKLWDARNNAVKILTRYAKLFGGEENVKKVAGIVGPVAQIIRGTPYEKYGIRSFGQFLQTMFPGTSSSDLPKYQSIADIAGKNIPDIQNPATPEETSTATVEKTPITPTETSTTEEEEKTATPEETSTTTVKETSTSTTSTARFGFTNIDIWNKFYKSTTPRKPSTSTILTSTIPPIIPPIPFGSSGAELGNKFKKTATPIETSTSTVEEIIATLTGTTPNTQNTATSTGSGGNQPPGGGQPPGGENRPLTAESTATGSTEDWYERTVIHDLQQARERVFTTHAKLAAQKPWMGRHDPRRQKLAIYEAFTRQWRATLPEQSQALLPGVDRALTLVNNDVSLAFNEMLQEVYHSTIDSLARELITKAAKNAEEGTLERAIYNAATDAIDLTTNGRADKAKQVTYERMQQTWRPIAQRQFMKVLNPRDILMTGRVLKGIDISAALGAPVASGIVGGAIRGLTAFPEAAIQEAGLSMNRMIGSGMALNRDLLWPLEFAMAGRSGWQPEFRGEFGKELETAWGAAIPTATYSNLLTSYTGLLHPGSQQQVAQNLVSTVDLARFGGLPAEAMMPSMTMLARLFPKDQQSDWRQFAGVLAGVFENKNLSRAMGTDEVVSMLDTLGSYFVGRAAEISPELLARILGTVGAFNNADVPTGLQGALGLNTLLQLTQAVGPQQGQLLSPLLAYLTNPGGGIENIMEISAQYAREGLFMTIPGTENETLLERVLTDLPKMFGNQSTAAAYLTKLGISPDIAVALMSLSEAVESGELKVRDKDVQKIIKDWISKGAPGSISNILKGTGYERYNYLQLLESTTAYEEATADLGAIPLKMATDFRKQMSPVMGGLYTALGEMSQGLTDFLNPIGMVAGMFKGFKELKKTMSEIPGVGTRGASLMSYQIMQDMGINPQFIATLMIPVLTPIVSNVIKGLGTFFTGILSGPAALGVGLTALGVGATWSYINSNIEGATDKLKALSDTLKQLPDDMPVDELVEALAKLRKEFDALEASVLKPGFMGTIENIFFPKSRQESILAVAKADYELSQKEEESVGTGKQFPSKIAQDTAIQLELAQERLEAFQAQVDDRNYYLKILEQWKKEGRPQAKIDKLQGAIDYLYPTEDYKANIAEMERLEKEIDRFHSIIYPNPRSRHLLSLTNTALATTESLPYDPYEKLTEELPNYSIPQTLTWLASVTTGIQSPLFGGLLLGGGPPPNKAAIDRALAYQERQKEEAKSKRDAPIPAFPELPITTWDQDALKMWNDMSSGFIKIPQLLWDLIQKSSPFATADAAELHDQMPTLDQLPELSDVIDLDQLETLGIATGGQLGLQAHPQAPKPGPQRGLVGEREDIESESEGLLGYGKKAQEKDINTLIKEAKEGVGKGGSAGVGGAFGDILSTQQTRLIDLETKRDATVAEAESERSTIGAATPKSIPTPQPSPVRPDKNYIAPWSPESGVAEPQVTTSNSNNTFNITVNVDNAKDAADIVEELARVLREQQYMPMTIIRGR